MKKVLDTLKGFLANKNTVTILGVIVGVFVLYFGYNYRVNQAINPVRVPYAKNTIQPRTQITADMIDYMEVPPAMISSNVIRSAENILDNYSNYNTIIPKGSLFYSETVIAVGQLPDAALIAIEEGDTPFNLPVTMRSTYGNSIFPNNYINIYFKCVNDDGQIMVGELISNVKVLAVKDSSGNPVFQNSDTPGTPAMVIFGVPNDIYLLLSKATYLGSTTTQAELIPVPTTEGYKTEPGEITYASYYLRDFINAKTANVPSDELYEQEITNPTDPTEPTEEENTENQENGA